MKPKRILNVPSKPYKVVKPWTYKVCLECNMKFKHENAYRFTGYSPGIGLYYVYVHFDCAVSELQACKIAQEYIHKNNRDVCGDLDSYIEFWEDI